MPIKYNAGSEEKKLIVSEKTGNYKINLRESRETYFWYTAVNRLHLGNKDMRRHLIQESKEIPLIMGSIASKDE